MLVFLLSALTVHLVTLPIPYPKPDCAYVTLHIFRRKPLPWVYADLHVCARRGAKNILHTGLF